MRAYTFKQVDAFTREALAGNACAVILNAQGLSDLEMLQVAREMNLSETAFVLPSAVADVRARYFTPAEEIPLAGHPTIATIHALVEAGALDGSVGTTVKLELPAGVIDVGLESDDGFLKVVMQQLRPTAGSRYDPDEVAPVFGLEPGDLIPGAPVETISTGTPQLMIPVRSHEALRRARLMPAAYTALRERGDFFSPHLFALGGATPSGTTFARHFGVPPDTPEDPFTGSATGGMAAYLWRHGLIEEPNFVAEQGHWMGRPGAADVEVIGPPEGILAVKVAGTAVTVIEGELRLP